MIDKGARFLVIDNTGAKEANFFAIPGMNSHKVQPGYKIKVSITKALPNKKVKKGQVYNAVVCSLKNPYNSGKTRTSFSMNAVALLNEKGEMLGTRILGPISGSPLLKSRFPDITSKGEVY